MTAAALSLWEALPNAWPLLGPILAGDPAALGGADSPAARVAALRALDRNVGVYVQREPLAEANERFAEEHQMLDEDGGVFRVVGVHLVCKRDPWREGVSLVARELNGVPIDARPERWRVIAVPPPSLTYAKPPSFGSRDAFAPAKAPAEAPEGDPAEDDEAPAGDAVPRSPWRAISRADDATRLTLGASPADGAPADAPPRWHIYTSRGWEMEDRMWVGAVKFGDALFGALAQLGVGPDRLDPRLSYSFLLHCGEYHPYERDTTRVTLVQAVALPDAADLPDGLPPRAALTAFRAGERGATGLPSPGEPGDDDDDALPTVVTCPGATAAAARALAVHDPALVAVPGPEWVDPRTPEAVLWTTACAPNPGDPATVAHYREGGDAPPYGFVLHPRAPGRPTLFVEGSLLRPIREMAYDRLPIDGELGPGERLRLRALRAHVRGMGPAWAGYFPQHAHWLGEFVEAIGAAVAATQLAAEDARAGRRPASESATALHAEAAAGITAQRVAPAAGGAAIAAYMLGAVTATPELAAQAADSANAGWFLGNFIASEAHLDILARCLLPTLAARRYPQ
jgi:hypothetical protein